MKRLHIYILFVLCFSARLDAGAQNAYVDSLEKRIKYGKRDTLVLADYIRLINGLKEAANYKDAALYCSGAMKLAEELKRSSNKQLIQRVKSYEGDILNALGDLATFKGAQSEALKRYAEAGALYRETGYTKEAAYLDASIGHVYHTLGNYPKALDHYLKCLAKGEQTKDKGLVVSGLLGSGNIYGETDENEKALNQYTACLSIAGQLGRKKTVANCYSNMGVVYQQMKAYEKAIGVDEKALAIYGELGLKKEASITLNNIGIVYMHKGESTKALEYYVKALKIGREINFPESTCFALKSIANVYMELNRFREAESCLDSALAIAKEINSIQELAEVNDNYSILYEKLDQPDKAMRHYRQYIAYEDSLVNEENKRQLVELEMNYEFEKREAIQEAVHEKEVIKLEAANMLARRMKNFILLAAVLVLLFVVLIFTYLRNRKKIVMQRSFSQSVLQSQETERRRVSKELHDSIGQNILFIKNQLARTGNDVLCNFVGGTLEQVRNISRELYPNQLEKYGLAAAIDALIEKVKETTGIFISHDLEGLQARLSEEKNIIIYRIVQECINNTIRQASASAIRITITRKQDNLELIVQDDAKSTNGREAGRKLPEFHGLKERIKLLRGKFNMEISPENGTRSVFLIPL